MMADPHNGHSRSAEPLTQCRDLTNRHQMRIQGSLPIPNYKRVIWGSHTIYSWPHTSHNLFFFVLAIWAAG